MKREFYTNLKEVRIKSDVTQQQLAEDLSISIRTIYRIENMKVPPNLILAMDIASYFNKKVDEMFWK